jgi:hypothetical protein
VSGAGAVAGVVGGTFVFGFIGHNNWVVGSIAGGLAAVLVAGGLSTASSRFAAKGKLGWFLAFSWFALPLCCYVAAYILSPLNTWGKAGPMLLFMALLPLLHSPFDWASVGLTRALLHRGLERGEWWPLLYALFDATLAVAVLAVLAPILVIGLQLFNEIAVHAGGRPVVQIARLLEGITLRPASPEFWWVYGLLLTTVVPSVINLMIGGASLVCGIPGIPALLARNMPIGRAPAFYNQTWIALLWTLQVVGGAILGIAAQAAIIVFVIGFLMPAIGLNLLGMCRTLFELNLPVHLLRSLGVYPMG